MDAVDAVIDCLRKLGATLGEPVNIYSIGTALVDAGFEPDAVVDALYTMESRQTIEVLPGNQIALLKPV